MRIRRLIWQSFEKLDDAIFNCVETIPEKNRKLVTYHDSFAYFAPRYGMKVIAAIQPSRFFRTGSARSHSYHQADKKGKGARHFWFRGFSQQGRRNKSPVKPA